MITKDTPLRTFKNKVITLGTADHQHLSNMIHYTTHIDESSTQNCVDATMVAIEQIHERFNGQVLPYRPHVEFIDEIRVLRKKNMLIDDTTKFRVIIMYDNVEIGEITNTCLKRLPR
jgi:hypothetical protein